MFKFRSQVFVTVVFILAAIGGLAGCASQAATIAEPISPPVQPTDPPLPPTVPTGQWEQVGKMESSTSLRMAAFMDQDTGITGGPNTQGIARTTSDGGKTWAVAGNSSQCLFGLEMIDAETMWECNASDMRVTTDGGQTWTDRIRGRGQPGCKISAIDTKTAWVVSPTQLVVTHDGGVTRETLALPGDLLTKHVAAISFRSQTDGYILDAAGKLYSTTDGGKTWEDMLSLDLSQYGELELRVNNGQPYAALRFFDADHGLVILSLAGGGASKVVALRTTDGGQTWNEQTIEAPYSTLYLTRDGKYLTTVSAFTNRDVTVFRYTGG